MNSIRFSGLLGKLCAITFGLIVLWLGLIQPGYNHFSHTTSYLVYGRLGFIQQVNFLLLSIAIASIGYGLGLDLTRKKFNSISFGSAIASAVMLLLFLFPTDRQIVGIWSEFDRISFSGKVHYFLSLALYAVAAGVVFSVVSAMKRHHFWRRFYSYTIVVLVSNTFFGILWFLLVGMGMIQSWKGLYQKGLILNVLVWMAVIGHTLWMEHVHVKSEKKNP